MATSVDDRVITGYEPKYVFMSELEIDYKHTHIKNTLLVRHASCNMMPHRDR